MRDSGGSGRRRRAVSPVALAAALAAVSLAVPGPVAAAPPPTAPVPDCAQVITDLLAGVEPGVGCAAASPRPGPAAPVTAGAVGQAPGAGAPAPADVAAAQAAAGPGAVSGRVTEDGSGDPVAGALVVAVSAAGVFTRGTVADGSGHFTLWLPAGSYRIEFVDPSGRHRSEWFDDRSVDDLAHAVALAVDAAAPLTADAALAPTGASGSIGGRVTESGTGTPVGGAWVIAVRARDGAIVGGVATAADGTYVVDGLEARNYRLAAIDPSLRHTYDLFFDDKADFSSGDDIAVSAGTTTVIDPDLDAATPPVGNATITGTVTDTGSGDPVAGAWVAAVDANTGRFSGAATADTDGRFSLMVPAGSYKVEFLDRTGGHRGEWFDDAPLGDFGTATPVAVGPTGTMTVDEDLAPLSGAIAGSVTETGSVVPVGGAWVIALRASDAAPAGLAVADAAGTFRIEGLAAGAYRVAVVDPSGTHDPELFYRDRATFASGDAVTVVAGGTTPVAPDLHSLAPTVPLFTATVSDTNLITLTWRTEGGDASNLAYLYDDTDPANPATGFRAQNGTTSFRVSSAGVRRFRLAVNSAAGARAVVPVSVTVPPLPPPVITSTNPALVDELAKQDVTITWRHGTGGFARITRPNGTKVDVAGTVSGSTVTGSYLVTAASQAWGSNVYRVAFCKPTPDPNVPLCSDGARAEVRVGPQRFTGGYRRFVTPGQTVTLGWTGSGNGRFFNVSSPRLGLSTWSGGSSLPVTLPADANGVYDLTLTTCATLASGTVCANRDDVTTPSAGTVAWVAPVGTAVAAGAEVARVTTATATVSLTAPRAGTVSLVLAGAGTAVAAGAPVVAVVVPDDVDHQQLVVSSRPWTTRSVLADFDSGAGDRVPVWSHREAGIPLDLAFSPDGDLWSVGEFGGALIGWTDSGLETYEVPLRTKLDSNLHLIPVNPFGAQGRPSAWRYSSLVERVITADGKVWFTQGGQLFGSATGNHSRVLSFDPSAVDLPSTDTDDRFCAVNVPNDGAEVTGLAYDGRRIWFTEEGVNRPTSVDSFDPDELPCDNLLDYSDPVALANAVHHYCTHPGEEGCIRRIELPGALGAAMLTFDPSDNAIWVTEFYGAALDRVDVLTGATQRWAEPPPDRPYGLGALFGGAPWQIRADADYVYLIDWGDLDLLRFHKDTGAFDELPLPMTTTGLGGHSIELVGTKLWFTEFGLETTDAATIGYVDTADWGPGVVYTGLSALVDGNRAGVGPTAPAGIAVSPTGTVAFADYWRRQLVLLRPKP